MLSSSPISATFPVRDLQAEHQFYTDMPEYSDNPNPAYMNERVRGTGGKPTSFGEENVLSLPIGPSMSSRTRGSGGLDIGGNVGRNERTFKREEAVCPT